MTEKRFQWPGRRAGDPVHEMLVAYLVMDVQRNPVWAHEIAERIKAVRSGELSEWERLGNAYRLQLTAKGVLIEDLVDDENPVQTISLNEFSKAIEAWMESMVDER